MYSRLLSLVAAGAAVLLTAVPAHATARATASITGLTVTLIDLDPNDGITPSIAFAGNSYSAISALVGGASDVYGQETVGAGALDPFSNQANTGFAWSGATGTGSAPATITGPTTIVGSLLVSGQTDGWNMNITSFNGEAVWNAYLWAPGSYTLSTFSISANTTVQISASVYAEASVSNFYYPNLATGREEAGSIAVLRMTGPGSNGSGTQETHSSFQTRACNGPIEVIEATQCLAPAAVDQGTFDASFTNATATSMSVDFIAFVQAGGWSQVAQPIPVPEPQIAALFLVGLGMLGVRRCRTSARG